MLKNRIIWFILWVLSIICISFFGGSVSYGIFHVLTIVPLLSLCYLLYVYVYFHIYQRVATKFPVAGKMVPYYFTLVDEYPLIFPGIRVKFYSGFTTIVGLSDDVEYELLPGTKIEKETGMICKYRGEYKAGIKEVVIQDFFRLFQITFTNKEALKVTVKPGIKEIDGINQIELLQVYNDSKMNATQLDVLTREYMPGDDVRRISWIQSARSEKLMVREYIGQEQDAIHLFFDTCRKSDSEKEYLPLENKILETVIAMTLYFGRKNIRTAIYYYDRGLKINHVASLNEFDGFYEAVSLVQFDKKNSLEISNSEAQKQGLSKCQTCILVVTKINSTVFEMMDQVACNGGNVVIVHISESDTSASINDNRITYIHMHPEDDLREVLS